MGKISVIIADDHRLIRDGIKLLLKENEEIELIAEAEDGMELIQKVDELKPDVILLDGSMPKMDGLTAMSKILEKHPETGIIMLSMHEDPDFVQKCSEAGALSYLLKNVGRDELISTIKKVAWGEKTFNPIVNELLIQGQLEARKRKSETIKISKREKEVMDCLAKGMSTKQMADTLFLSSRTVESHRLRLLKKFGAQNATELLRTAVEKRIIKI
ncbi:MAG: response regulator transcription factor [Cytophagales bacterium]|nr:response regulator transcription factor [Cytophagales bacterium]